jgi:hypothetical protein
MVPLHQPKWRKFLSLKGEASKPSDMSTLISDDKSISHVNDTAKESTTVDPVVTPKKRKRTEEEIALRKAKKLKSKDKEGQEWKQLVDSHQNQQATPSKAESSPEATESNASENYQDAKKDSKPESALLSKKAKEIAKARRDEKLQTKQEQAKKQKVDDLDTYRKSNQVLEYLEQYQAHLDSGADWKFKKQYQNWIVKHLYSFPWKSDDLVIRYLKSVQGSARERLITTAREVKEEEKGVHGEDAIRRAESVILALNG